MQPNILYNKMPSTVMVGGISVPIKTDYRTGIRVLKIADDPELDEREKVYLILLNYYAEDGTIPPRILEHQEEAIEKALLFLNFNEARPPKVAGIPVSKERTWDWDWDAKRVLADFHREYSIDLSDPQVDMHWWNFYSRFKGLSDTSQTMNAVSIRGTQPNKDMSSAEKKRLKAQKASVLLPARTEEEAQRLTKFVWSLD